MNNKLAPCIITLCIFCIFNSVVYSYLIYLQKKEDNLLLRGYLSGIESLLTQDLENAFNSALSNKKFFLLKDLEVIILPKPAVNSITINSYAIKVQNQREEYIFDLHNLKENISKIFPTFITYTLSLNNHDIMGDGNQKTKYDLVQSKSLGLNNILTLQLKINRNSIFYVDKQYRLQKIILIFSVSSFLIFSVFLYFYLRVSNHIIRQFKILNQEIYDEKKINTALLNNIKVDHYLKKLFIRKLTEMYLKQELGETYEPNNISFKNQLFPIYLTDISPAKINIESLTKLLQDYFAPYFTKIGLRVTSNIKDIELNCSIEVFYQLIFSLVFNLVKFMDRQSNVPQILKIDFKQDKITIVNDCFPLDERKMIKLSDIIIEEYIDVFILNCHKIFKSLKEHKFKYSIFSNNRSNIIEIIYPPLNKSNNASNKNMGRILDITKYINRS